MKRTVLWSVLLSSGVMILLLLAAIVTIMVKPLDSTLEIKTRFDTVDTSSPTSQGLIVDEDIQDKIKIIYGRKGYSNPKSSSEDEDDPPERVVTRRKWTRRPPKIIGKDFNPCQSYTIRHLNGTLTYVFPCPSSTTSPPNPEKRLTTSTINSITEKDQEGSSGTQATYPTALIDDIMNEHISRFEGAFGDDMMNGDALNSRFDISNDQFLCESAEKLYLPTEGLTYNNSSVLIVNTKKFKQGVRIETCRDEGTPCKYCVEHTVCKQLYHYRTLVVINLDEKKPYKELIQLPSSCKCARIAV